MSVLSICKLFDEKSQRKKVQRKLVQKKTRSKENSPSDAALSQTPGHPAAGGFCPETRGKKGLECITGHVTEGRCFT